MKFNFKKIMSVTASAVMLGSTLGTAMAAAYPVPFVEDGNAMGAVVYGANAAVTDATAAIDLSESLGGMVTSEIAVTGSSVTGGDSVKLERTTNLFNLGNNMSEFYSKIDESELSTVLAEGVYTNDAHNDYDYTQEILLGSDLQLTHFLNSDFNDEKPIIGFDLNSGDLIMNYTLKFTEDAQGVDADWSGITNSYIPILGEEYYVLSMTNTTATNHKITLLNAATSGVLAEGESITLTADGVDYEVSVAYIDGTKVKLNINGETTDSLLATETQKLSSGAYLGIKEVNSQGYAGGISDVEFSIGTGKLVLENTKEVELNSDKLSVAKYAVANSDEELQHEVNSFIVTDGTNLDSVVIEWKLKDDTWIAPGTELTLPGFESIKLAMGGFNTEATEVTNIKGDSNKLTLKTTITDGDLTLNMFYLNSSSTGIEGLGKDSTHKLVTSETTGDTSTPISISLNESLNNYFVVTWISGDDAETYAYKLDSVDETKNNATTIKSLSNGASITMDAEGEYETEGNVKFLLNFAREKYPSKAYVTLNVTAATSGSVYANRIVTAEGMEIALPVINSTTNATGLAVGNYQIAINGSYDPVAWTQMFDEEDRDNTISNGAQFNATYAISGTDGLEVSTLAPATLDDLETEDSSDKWIGYVSSDLATMILLDKPSSGLNELDITYNGQQAYADVFISEMSAVVVGGDASEGGKILVVKDSDVSSVSDKNLIVVGGSCINTVAAKMLNSEVPLCGDDFSTSTEVGAGQYLIKVAVSPYSEDKIAMLVAGYDAEDTTNAVSKVKEGVTTDIGESQVYPIVTA